MVKGLLREDVLNTLGHALNSTDMRQIKAVLREFNLTLPLGNQRNYLK